MGEVIPLDYFSRRWPDDRPGLREPYGPWRAIDLRGRRPDGHPGAPYGPNGRVILVVGQVWVECDSQRLYVIKQLDFTNSSLYSYDVAFEEYGRGGQIEIYPDEVFRSQMQVWDEFDSLRSASKVPRVRVVNESSEIGCSIYDGDGYRID